ncbi:hypothetical protein [uncultured Lactobacillus sp.]|uniref:hypothetical protein n=1 Tax=uncultured Lactobacillus sp. TaxID=153152 RepID=UPI00266615C4|nr:hypothetical protein [uncultured Lactobacillus sp.]
MDFLVHLIGAVSMLNVLVAKATLLMWGIAFFFRATHAAANAYWCFREDLRKHKKSRSKNDH